MSIITNFNLQHNCLNHQFPKNFSSSLPSGRFYTDREYATIVTIQDCVIILGQCIKLILGGYAQLGVLCHGGHSPAGESQRSLGNLAKCRQNKLNLCEAMLHSIRTPNKHIALFTYLSQKQKYLC